MKKINIILIAAFTLFSLVACGRNDAPMNTETKGSMPTILPTMDTNIPDPDTNADVTENTWMTDPGLMGAENDATNNSTDTVNK